MDGVLNAVRREVGRVLSRLALPKCGTVTAYDPATHSAKVLLHPEEVETGWLPIRSPWSGNDWGMFAPPTPGDEVEVQFQEGGKQAGYVALRAFGDRFRPLPVPSGEFWLVHKSGGFLKFTNDGKFLVNGTAEIDVTTPVLNITAPRVNVIGDMYVTGNIFATGDITDLNGASGSLNGFRQAYDIHTHISSSGGGITTVPTPQV